MSPNRPTVIITETLGQDQADWLADHAHVLWCKHDEGQAFDERLAQAEGLVVRTYTQVDEALLARAPWLKVVGRAGVGLDNIDLAACRKRGVQVVSTPDANTQAVVEYVFGLIWDHLRPRTVMPPRCDAATFHALRKSEVGRQLDELSLGILGFGRIGKRLGRVAHALGVPVHVCDLIPEEELRREVEYPFHVMPMGQLFAESDVVSVHVDGRPENHHLLNAESLEALRPEAMLINAARGMLIDSQALADWAAAHPKAHVVLDVHETEPPTADYPLWDLPNVRLLPHLASRTDQALANMSWVVRDVARVLRGETPQYPAF